LLIFLALFHAGAAIFWLYDDAKRVLVLFDAKNIIWRDFFNSLFAIIKRLAMTQLFRHCEPIKSSE
jgi:hypothetical protein